MGQGSGLQGPGLRVRGQDCRGQGLGSGVRTGVRALIGIKPALSPTYRAGRGTTLQSCMMAAAHPLPCTPGYRLHWHGAAAGNLLVAVAGTLWVAVAGQRHGTAPTGGRNPLGQCRIVAGEGGGGAWHPGRQLHPTHSLTSCGTGFSSHTHSPPVEGPHLTHSLTSCGKGPSSHTPSPPAARAPAPDFPQSSHSSWPGPPFHTAGHQWGRNQT